ncbi:MAG: hypothetical protein LBQ79_14635 [Deltaproteobacteria bacterium]|nr:hypothetical protein [Deltaproteobacteria bacterium]
MTHGTHAGHGIPARTVLAALLAAFLSATALCGSSPAQPEASSYRTGDDSSLKAFGDMAVSFPSWLTKTGEASIDAADNVAQITIAGGNSPSGEHHFEMAAIILALSPTQAGEAGSTEFWKALEPQLRPDSSASYSGIRTFEFKGLPAAELDYSSVTPPRPPVVVAGRVVISASHLYMVVCGVSGVSADAARFKGFASREIPPVAEVCIPYLDSLEVGR